MASTFSIFRLRNRIRPIICTIGCLLGVSWNTLAFAETLKVAFVADQGTNEHAQAVLELIKNEAVELLLIQGDLGYKDGKAIAWEENLTRILGEDFPVLTVVGNHENFEWPAYKQFISDRIDRVPELNCVGEVGVKATCTYKGVTVVQVAPGISEVEGVAPKDDYAGYLQQQLSKSASAWRICSWHKNQRLMQLGDKNDDTGWAVYQACLSEGAIVATGHEHSYGRTFLMEDFENQTVADTADTMVLEKGRSFAFVSGLGGIEIRPQIQDGEWWAAKYTTDQGASHGALFCTIEGLSANCYFKDITGAVPDTFTVQTAVNGDSSANSSGAITPIFVLILSIFLLRQVRNSRHNPSVKLKTIRPTES